MSDFWIVMSMEKLSAILASTILPFDVQRRDHTWWISMFFWSCTRSLITVFAGAPTIEPQVVGSTWSFTTEITSVDISVNWTSPLVLGALTMGFWPKCTIHSLMIARFPYWSLTGTSCASILKGSCTSTGLGSNTELESVVSSRFWSRYGWISSTDAIDRPFDPTVNVGQGMTNSPFWTIHVCGINSTWHKSTSLGVLVAFRRFSYFNRKNFCSLATACVLVSVLICIPCCTVSSRMVAYALASFIVGILLACDACLSANSCETLMDSWSPCPCPISIAASFPASFKLGFGSSVPNPCIVAIVGRTNTLRINLSLMVRQMDICSLNPSVLWQ